MVIDKGIMYHCGVLEDRKASLFWLLSGMTLCRLLASWPMQCLAQDHLKVRLVWEPSSCPCRILIALNQVVLDFEPLIRFDACNHGFLFLFLCIVAAHEASLYVN